MHDFDEIFSLELTMAPNAETGSRIDINQTVVILMDKPSVSL